jgi:hypothetical protein
MKMHRSFGTIAIAIGLLCAPLVREARAQQLPKPAIELAIGTLNFADDGIVTEGFAGGAARFYVLPRISIGPEIAFIEGINHSHMMLTGNVTFDFLRPANGGPRRVTPYAVVGAGLFRTSELFPGTGTFASSEGAFTAGGGVRARVTRNVTLGAEARLGWEAHIRVNGLIGVQFGGS